MITPSILLPLRFSIENTLQATELHGWIEDNRSSVSQTREFIVE
jgi:hypothetical protein